MFRTVLFLPAVWPIYCGIFFILRVSWEPYYFLCKLGCYLVFISSLKICTTDYEPSNVTCHLLSLDNQILREVYNVNTILFWDIMQRVTLIICRRLGDCTETSARNYHYSLRNSPEEQGSYLLRGGSLKSRIV